MYFSYPKQSLLAGLLLLVMNVESLSGAPQIVVFSIPKAGTTLIAKLVYQLTRRAAVGRFTPDRREFYRPSSDEFEKLTNLPIDRFLSSHLFYNPEYAAQLQDDRFSCFFLYRDPRDEIISFMFYMIQQHATWPAVIGKTYDEIIMNLIESGSFLANNPPSRGIYDLYASYMPWRDEPNFLAIKFEDLVGKRGGGSDEVQLNTIKDIADHMKKPISDATAQAIGKSLFGDTTTFRQGKIGSWKRYFKPEHKQRFKELAGQLLIDLGYESDFEW